MSITDMVKDLRGKQENSCGKPCRKPGTIQPQRPQSILSVIDLPSAGAHPVFPLPIRSIFPAFWVIVFHEEKGAGSKGSLFLQGGAVTMEKLAETYFFRDLDDKEIDTLKTITKIKEVGKGETILKQGESSR